MHKVHSPIALVHCLFDVLLCVEHSNLYHDFVGVKIFFEIEKPLSTSALPCARVRAVFTTYFNCGYLRAPKVFLILKISLQ